MKKILALTGVQKLNRKQQSTINGSGTSITCCGGNKCRISFPGGSFCEPGHCNPFGFGGCILY